MGNEGQQPPLPEQGKPEQQGYYGWQYDPDETEVVKHSPSNSPQGKGLPRSSPQPLSPQPLPPQPLPPQGTPSQRLPSQPLPPQSSRMPVEYQQPIQDMGTSLGYGQAMEYQYFDAPQPSQPMAQLRLERLQQLREERMRRQQRRMKPDITTLFPWDGKGKKWSGSLPEPSSQVTNLPMEPPSLSQMSPRVFLPSRPAEEEWQVRSSPLPSLSAPANEALQPAIEPAQDTGMIQKARMGRAALILTGAFIASRFLGVMRSSMFAFVFGTGSISDAYLQAFLVPDFIFTIVAGGALSSAFIPVFTHYMIAERDERSAWHITSSALNLAVGIMMALALLVIIFERMLVPLYNPGIHDPLQLDLIASLTRIMLLQSVVFGAGVIVTAVLNSEQDFKSPAIGTVLYNVGLIVGLIPGVIFAVTGHRNDQIAVYAATWGVVIGALLQVGVQVPGLIKVRMKYSFSFDWRHPGVIQIGRQMIPRIINSGMLYASTFVDRGLILLLVVVVGQAGVKGLITQYYQAFQLVLLPLGILGQSVSTAAFPTMAENVAKGRLDRVRNMILETLRSILFLSIPSSVGLIVLGFPTIQVLLQHGAYSLADAQSTAVPLAFFALGLAGMTSVEILTRSFYAMRDSRTPVIISVGQFVFKIALSLAIIDVAVFGVQWGLGALAFSTSIANLLEAAILFWLLHQRIGDLQPREIGIFIVRALIAAVAMGIVLIVVRFVLDLILVTTREPALGLLGTMMAFIKLIIEIFVGLFVYLRASRLLGIEEMGPVKRVLDRLKLSWI